MHADGTSRPKDPPDREDRPVTQAEFVQALESELQLQGVPFDRAALLALVASMWPLAEDDPDVTRWAAAFLEAGSVAGA
jgi:hypothetical protein